MLASSRQLVHERGVFRRERSGSELDQGRRSTGGGGGVKPLAPHQHTARNVAWRDPGSWGQALTADELLRLGELRNVPSPAGSTVCQSIMSCSMFQP